MYWDGRFPRLITTAQMKELHDNNNHRLLGVADISADLQVCFLPSHLNCAAGIYYQFRDQSNF